MLLKEYAPKVEFHGMLFNHYSYIHVYGNTVFYHNIKEIH